MRQQNSRTARPTWVVPVLILAGAALLIALVLALAQKDDVPGGKPGPTTAGGPTEVEDPTQPDLTRAERRDPDDLLATGPVDAPVTLVVFSDYQCKYCAKWSHETLPLMMEHVESGDLRIEWRDVNVFGPASERAARASYAAALQGQFWEYHEVLFAGGEKRSEADLSDGALTDLAGGLGLDVEKFATDLTAPETTEQIEANAQLGLDLGAYSTPSFLLGGEPIVGAQPSQAFLDAFDRALAAAG